MSGDVAESGYAAGLQWREPDFLRRGYTLSYSAGYEEEETVAYDIRRAYTGVGLEIPFAGARTAVELGPFEIKTLVFDPRRRVFTETDLRERPLKKRR